MLHSTAPFAVEIPEWYRTGYHPSRETDRGNHQPAARSGSRSPDHVSGLCPRRRGRLARTPKLGLLGVAMEWQGSNIHGRFTRVWAVLASCHLAGASMVPTSLLINTETLLSCIFVSFKPKPFILVIAMSTSLNVPVNLPCGVVFPNRIVKVTSATFPICESTVSNPYPVRHQWQK